MRSVSFSLCVVALAVGMASCKSSTSNPAAPSPPANGGTQAQKTITIPTSDVYGNGSTNYSPRTVTVQVGGSVVWSNRDTEKHTTVSDTGVWSSDIAPGADFTRTFPAAGTFNFHCSLHPGMTGTITVQ